MSDGMVQILYCDCSKSVKMPRRRPVFGSGEAGAEAAKPKGLAMQADPKNSGCPTLADSHFLSGSSIDPIESVYGEEDLSRIDLSHIPKHIAIIMDGNRRWARQRNLPAEMGHWEGAEVLTDIVRASAELGVKTLTVFAFSTENWNRPEKEVEDLMDIFELYLIRKQESMVRDGVRLDAIGDLARLPKRVLTAFHQTKQATAHCDRIQLLLAINYGGRDEIRRAVRKILAEKIEADQITEECIARHLDTGPYGDPELLIRTSGEMRVSNFLLWQISYAEIVSTNTLWPDFSPKELIKTLETFQLRNRRLGN